MKMKCFVFLLAVLFFIPVISFAKDTQDLDSLKAQAEAGNSHAMYLIGLMYYEGTTVAQDDQEAFAWYTKAADAGDKNAMTKLGGMYEHGEGAGQNPITAYMWYDIAATLGNTNAVFSRESLSLTTSQVERGKQLSRQWLNQHHYQQ